MHHQQRKASSKRLKFVSKRNYQYLGLLGVSLFSLSLSQINPVNVHADATGEQTEVVGNQTSQSSSSSSASSSTGSSTTSSNISDTSNGSNGSQTKQNTQISTAKITPSVEKPVSSGSEISQESNDSSKDMKPKTKINLAKDAAPVTSAVTPTDVTPSNLVVIKNGDSSVQLDNQLKLSRDQTTTLGDVTATNPDNFTYDVASQTANITGPAAGQVTIDTGVKASNGVSTVYVAPVVSVPTVQAAPVIVRYFSSKGVLKKTVTLTGNLGEAYTTNVKKPAYESGYTVDQSKWPKNAQGVFTNVQIFVDYYYAAPIDSWKSYKDQTQVNTVVNGNKKLMDLNVYYPNGAKVSLTVTSANQVLIHTLSPNGYSTKTISLVVGEEQVIEDSNGSIYWAELLPNGTIDLTYRYGQGLVEDYISNKGELMSHSFQKLISIGLNTVSGAKNSKESNHGKNDSSKSSSKNFMTENRFQALRAFYSSDYCPANSQQVKRTKGYNLENLKNQLPRTDDHQQSGVSFVGFVGLILGMLGTGHLMREKEHNDVE